MLSASEQRKGARRIAFLVRLGGFVGAYGDAFREKHGGLAIDRVEAHGPVIAH